MRLLSQFHSLHGRRLTKKLALGLTAMALSLISFEARSVVTIVSVEGASFAENLAITGEVPTIYGGVAGSLLNGSCATRDGVTTCDSCYNPGLPNPDDNLVACNNRRIYPTLLLRISIRSDKVESGKPVVTSSDGEDFLTLDPSTPSLVSKDNVVTIYVPWSSICNSIGNGDSDCIPSGNQHSGTLRVGISGDQDNELTSDSDDYVKVSFVVRRDIGQTVDGTTSTTDVAGLSWARDCSAPDNVAVCSFVIKSGDEKAVLERIDAKRGFPNSTDIQFKHVRAYFIEGPRDSVDPAYFSQINSGTTTYQDLEITSTSETQSTVTPRTITSGIRNDKIYYFKLAVVDKAGNVGYFTPSSLDTYCPDLTATSYCHIAVPGEVAGVLAEDLNCFISSAAYGSVMAPQVETFRQFRDQVLNRNWLGQTLIEFYYEHSPGLASKISQSETLRFMSRLTLWPVLSFVSLSLSVGLAAACGVFLLGFCVLCGSTYLLISHIRKRGLRA